MHTIGIDLGTTASAVAFVHNGVPKIIAVDGGKSTVPSVVNYGDGFPIVGREAIYKVDSSSTIFSVKRFMGTNEKFLSRTPEEISADILSFLKRKAEQVLRVPLDAAVITVPAHFSNLQRVATKKAASMAGIKVLRLINEPTAAAIAFGLDKKQDGIFGVYDFGGGTFDFSILRMSKGVFQVLATGGDTYLGGDDVDSAILEYNLRQNNLDMSQLNEREKLLGILLSKSMKEQLVSLERTHRQFVYRGNNCRFQLSRDILGEIVTQFSQRTLQIADQVFVDSKVNKSDIAGIVAVGGMTKIPLVKKAIADHFCLKIFDELNPEEVVALGAAIHADSISAKNVNSLLIDVVPLTLGIETIGGTVDKIIYRNSPVPIVQKREYTTYRDNQTGIKFHVVQGERAMARDCFSIASFELSDISPMPAGKAMVSVEFSMDVNGILHIAAFEKNSETSKSIAVETNSELSNEEMMKILQTAEAHRQKDAEESASVTTKVEAGRMISFWESIVCDLPIEERPLALEAIGDLKAALKEDDYQKLLHSCKRTEDIFNKYLDEIIGKRLTGLPVI
jgi:molecular chaperone HscA